MNGILYAGTGKSFVKEIIKSIKSVRKYDNEINIQCFVDDLPMDFIDDNVEFILIKNPKYSYEDKIEAMSRTKFDHTLFLDTDTIVLSEVSDMFKILKNFNIACSHAPIRVSPNKSNHWEKSIDFDLPDCFPEYNTGVILYDRNAIDLIIEWRKLYIKVAQGLILPDQPIFRKVLFDAKNIRIATLTPEYNLRFIFPSYVFGKVIILHGRNSEILIKKINKVLCGRVVLFSNTILAEKNNIYRFLNLTKKIYLKIKEYLF